MKKKFFSAFYIASLLLMVASISYALPTYTGFTTRSSGYVVTASDWNNEFSNFITSYNTNVIGTLNLLLGKGNILSSNGSTIGALANAGSGDDGKVLTLDSTQTNGLSWTSGGSTGLTTSGDIVYYNSGNQRLGIGTSGQVLTVSSGLPSWQDSAALPSGVILLWTGSLSAVPTGYQLCDGTNGTPNLQGCFIVGSGNVSPAATGGFGLLAQGATGGATTHTHTTSAAGSTSASSSSFGASGGVGFAPSGHTHSVVTSGTAAASSSAPSYYALAYIMKL